MGGSELVAGELLPLVLWWPFTSTVVDGVAIAAVRSGKRAVSCECCHCYSRRTGHRTRWLLLQLRPLEERL